jgi:hypothetical protein
MPDEQPTQHIAPYLKRRLKLPYGTPKDVFDGITRRAERLGSLIAYGEGAFKWGLALLAVEVAGLLPLTLYVLMPEYGGGWQVLFIVVFALTLVLIIIGGVVALLCWYFLILEVGFSLTEWAGLWVQRFATLTTNALRPRNVARIMRPGKRKRG